MINTNKLIYYISCIIVSVLILMTTGEEVCKCDCANVQEYAVKSYVFGDEYFVNKTSTNANNEQKDETLCTENKKIYRFPIEIIAVLLFLTIMTAFIIF